MAQPAEQTTMDNIVQFHPPLPDKSTVLKSVKNPDAKAALIDALKELETLPENTAHDFADSLGAAEYDERGAVDFGTPWPPRDLLFEAMLARFDPAHHHEQLTYCREIAMEIGAAYAEAESDLKAREKAKAQPKKEKRPEAFRYIDSKLKNITRDVAVDDLELDKIVRQIVKANVLGDNSTGYLAAQIAGKTHMTMPQVKQLVKSIVKEVNASNRPKKNQAKKDAEGSIVGQDDHAALVSHARNGLKKANETDPKIFRYGTEFARVEHVPEEGTTSVSILNKDGLRAAVNGCTDFQRIDEKGDARGVSTPVDVVADLYQDQLAFLPYLRGVSTYPQFDSDGEFLASNGYHASAYLFMQLPDDLEMPAVSTVPTEEEVDEAVRLLILEWLADFPFDGYSRREILVACKIVKPRPPEAIKPVPASLVNFLAFVLQPLVRPIIGNHPMPATLITKPESGTGASLLVSLVQLLITGKPSVRPPFPSDQDEQRKEVLTALRGGAPFIFLDNVVGNMDSPVLAALLTSVSFTGRILGRSEEVSVPNTASTIITGNNPRFTRELQRRLSLVRLDAGVPNPDKRDDWHLDNVEEWTGNNRGQLLWALATLVMNWQAKKKPKPAGTPLASYRDWYYVCGGILKACGLGDAFQSNRDQIEQVAGNDDDDPVRDLVAQWYDVATKPGTDMELTGQYAKELAALADAREIELPVAKHVVDSERIYKHAAFGKFLGTQAERVFAIDGVNMRIESGEKTKHGKPWGLVVVPVGK